jgi:hypothetical protein
VNTSADQSGGLIRNRRHAIVAVLGTLVVFASGLHGILGRIPNYGHWPLEPPPQWVYLRPLFVGLSIFVWAFVLWILFWFYRAASGKYERFLVVAFAISFILNTAERFVAPKAAADLQFLSVAASLVAVAAALTLFFKFFSKTTTPAAR